MTPGGVLLRTADACADPADLIAPVQLRASKPKRLPESVVEAEIGPRLVLFHHDAQPVAPPAVRPSSEDVERLAMLVIGRDEAETVAHFGKVCAQEHSYATLLLYFLAPAAHLLGEYWKSDVCTFFDVTVGVGRLQTLMDGLTMPEPVLAADAKRRALLVALPGETHLLGPRMVARLLEATGWDVTLQEHLTGDVNANAVAAEWIGVVGVSLSSASRAEIAARTISMIREVSLNKHVAIMAGGSAINENPELAVRIGADAVGVDAPTTAILAAHLLMRQASLPA